MTSSSYLGIPLVFMPGMHFRAHLFPFPQTNRDIYRGVERGSLGKRLVSK